MCPPLCGESHLCPGRAGPDHGGPLHQLRAVPGGLSPECEDLCKRYGTGKRLSETGVPDGYLHCPVLCGGAGLRPAGAGRGRALAARVQRGPGDGGGRGPGDGRVQEADPGRADAQYHHHMLSQRERSHREILSGVRASDGAGRVAHDRPRTIHKEAVRAGCKGRVPGPVHRQETGSRRGRPGAGCGGCDPDLRGTGALAERRGDRSP